MHTSLDLRYLSQRNKQEKDIGKVQPLGALGAPKMRTYPLSSIHSHMDMPPTWRIQTTSRNTHFTSPSLGHFQTPPALTTHLTQNTSKHQTCRHPPLQCPTLNYTSPLFIILLRPLPRPLPNRYTFYTKHLHPAPLHASQSRHAH